MSEPTEATTEQTTAGGHGVTGMPAAGDGGAGTGVTGMPAAPAATDPAFATDAAADTGIDATTLTDDDLQRELGQLHLTRNETFRHGSADALANHDARTAALEAEYLRRWPDREVDPQRLRH